MKLIEPFQRLTKEDMHYMVQELKEVDYRYLPVILHPNDYEELWK